MTPSNFTFLWLSPLSRGVLALDLNKFESPSPKDNLYQVWLILACWFWRRYSKKYQSECIFTLFAIISPWRKAFSFILTNLNPLPLRMICASCFWRSIDFLKIFSVFLLFCYYLPVKIGVSLHLNKLESPPSKDDLRQLWLKFGTSFYHKEPQGYRNVPQGYHKVPQGYHKESLCLFTIRIPQGYQEELWGISGVSNDTSRYHKDFLEYSAMSL
jgi:hypothetical protein